MTELGTILTRILLKDLILLKPLFATVSLGLSLVALGNVGIGYIGLLTDNIYGWFGALLGVRLIQGLG